MSDEQKEIFLKVEKLKKNEKNLQNKWVSQLLCTNTGSN